MAKPVSGLTSPQISTSPLISQGADLIHPAIMEAVTRALASSEEWAKKGNEDRHQKDFKTAIEKLTLAIEIDPNNAFALARRGDCFFQQGKFDEAIADLTRAYELKHKPVFVLARRGDCFRRKGMVYEAIADLNIVLMRMSKHVFALASRGDCYRKEGLWSKAFADLTLAIAIMPDNAFALARRGACYLRIREPAKALLDFTKANQLKPNSLFTLQEMAECFRIMDKFDQSIFYAGRALEIMRRVTPDDKSEIGRVLLRRGKCLEQKGLLDEAIKDFSEVIDLVPGLHAYRSRATCYQLKFLQDNALGELLDKAIEDFDCALKFGPDPDFAAKTYSQMGNVNILKGEWGEAIKCFTLAITHKEEAYYYAQRGDAHMVSGNYTLAMQDVQRALNLDPNLQMALGVKRSLESLH